MSTVTIYIDGTATYSDALVAGTPVALTCVTDLSPVNEYRWVLLDVPDGSAATLDTPSESACAFTPDIAGSYRISLSLNGGAVATKAVAALLTAPFPLSVPAIGETVDAGVRGWGGRTARDFKRIAGMLGNGAVVICRASGAGIMRGSLVDWAIGGVGSDGIPLATLLDVAEWYPLVPWGIVAGGIDGETSVDDGDLCRIVVRGVATGVTLEGAEPSIGDRIGPSKTTPGYLSADTDWNLCLWGGDGTVYLSSDYTMAAVGANGPGEVVETYTGGTIVSSGVALADLARRAAAPTAGHLATLDADGDPVDSGYTIESVGSDVLLTTAAAITTAFASTDAAYLNKHLVVAAGTYSFADDVVIAGNRHITCRPGVRFEFAAGKKLRTRCSADGTSYESGSRTVTYAAGVFTQSSGDWSTLGVDNTWALVVAGHGMFVPQTVNATTIAPTYAPLADHQISAVHFALFKPVDALVMDGQLTMTAAGVLSAEFVGLRYSDLSGLRLTIDTTGYTTSGILSFIFGCYASSLPHLVVQRYIASTDAELTVLRFANNYNCCIKLTCANNSRVAALSTARACNAMAVLYCADCDIDATIGNLYAADSGAAYAVYVRGIFAYLDYRCAFTGRAWPVRWGGHGSSTAKGIDVNGGANNIVTGFYSGGETS